MKRKVLIVTDNGSLAQLLRHAFEAAHMTVLTADSAENMMALLESHQPNLMIMQSELRDMSRSELANLCSEPEKSALVLLDDEGETKQIAVESDEKDVEEGAEIAPDPLHMISADTESSRWTAEHRRMRCLSVGDVTLDLNGHAATVGDRSRSLSPLETKVLQVLMEHFPRVVPPELLAAHVWPDAEGDPSTLAAGISGLRAALADDPLGQSRIRHVEGYGYRISLTND